MNLKTALLKSGTTAALIGLPLGLAGCGGSGHSSDSSATAASNMASIHYDTGLGQSGYDISVSTSGVATYTYSHNPAQQPVPQNGSATLPVALASKFFQDLAAAAPVSQLPRYTGGMSAGAGSFFVKYQDQTGSIDNLSDAREKALADDADAIAKALGIPPL